MKYFCDRCKNLLDVLTANDKLIYKCQTCYTVYNSEDDDSLRYEETQGGDLDLFRTILANAKDDPVNLKARITCPKCKHHIAKCVRLGKELKLINVCEECDFRWMATE